MLDIMLAFVDLLFDCMGFRCVFGIATKECLRSARDHLLAKCTHTDQFDIQIL